MKNFLVQAEIVNEDKVAIISMSIQGASEAEVLASKDLEWMTNLGCKTLELVEIEPDFDKFRQELDAEETSVGEVSESNWIELSPNLRRAMILSGVVSFDKGTRILNL